MIKVLHVITGLNTGGAEMMLYRLLAASNRDEFCSTVISLGGKGTMGARIEELGVPVLDMQMGSGFPEPNKFRGLVRSVRGLAPDLIQTWMYHADLMGAVAAKLSASVPVVWGIHNGNLSRANTKMTTIMTARLCALLSNLLPTRIVCCSRVAGEMHSNLGYDRKKMVLINNGFDIDLFKPCDTKASVCSELGIKRESVLIGIVARFDPQKDHENFIKAAALVGKKYPHVHFLMCGSKISPDNKNVAGWIDGSGMSERFHLLGPRTDVPRLVGALDIYASSSYSEAFPLVVGEAMSSGVPCVTTDVGDSSLLLGDTGRIVTARNSEALAAALSELVELGAQGRRLLGQKARQRVVDNFSLGAVARQYEGLYRELLHKKRL